MTRAIISFFEDELGKVNVYYNSDGYPEYVGKIVANFIASQESFESIKHLIGEYILSAIEKTYELIIEKSGEQDFQVDYTYNIKYNSRSKVIEEVEVIYYGGDIEFSGNSMEFQKWIADKSNN